MWAPTGKRRLDFISPGSLNQDNEIGLKKGFHILETPTLGFDFRKNLNIGILSPALKINVYGKEKIR